MSTILIVVSISVFVWMIYLFIKTWIQNFKKEWKKFHDQ